MKKTNSVKHASFISKWINENRPIFIICIICLIVMILTSVLLIVSYFRESGQDYYINVNESFSLDCNLKHNEANNSYYCDGEISGFFSNYPNVTLSESTNSDFHIDGNTFSKNYSYEIPSSMYKTDAFNRSSLESINKEIELNLYNSLLMKNVVTKKTNITFKLSSSEIDTLESERNNSSGISTQQVDAKTNPEEPKTEAKREDNGEELPDDISPYDIKALCERSFESLGYPNAKISLTNQYAMGYPPYIYVIVGNLSYKENSGGSRVQVGLIQCQANWQTWSVKSITINGQIIF